MASAGLMLIWKTQTLNVNVASLRYRCLLPLKYLTQPLAQQGIEQTIVGSADPVPLTPETTAIIFVKSFRDHDLETCEQAHHLGTPIILDLCDNIFIADYAADSQYVPAKNFRQMAQYAIAIVTTGEALKAQIETALAKPFPERIAPLNITTPIIVIPDASETLADIEYACRTTRWQRLWSLKIRPAQRRLRSAPRRLRAIQGQLRTAQKRLRGRYSKAKSLKSFIRVALLSPVKKQIKHLLGIPTEKSEHQTPTSPATSQTGNRPESTAVTFQRVLSVQPTPWMPEKWPEAAPGGKTILWFGSHGAKYGSFGMESILDVAETIERISHELPLRLVVVSNSRDKYQHYIEPLPFETVYLRWHPRQIYDYIHTSDVTIIPNSQSVYSICKSANRAVLSLSQGTPVVASRTPALKLFENCVVLDDWERGLRQYLLQPEVGKRHIALAQRAIAQNLSGDKIAQKWLALLEQVAHRSDKHDPAA